HDHVPRGATHQRAARRRQPDRRPRHRACDSACADPRPPPDAPLRRVCGAPLQRTHPHPIRGSVAHACSGSGVGMCCMLSALRLDSTPLVAESWEQGGVQGRLRKVGFTMPPMLTVDPGGPACLEASATRLLSAHFLLALHPVPTLGEVWATRAAPTAPGVGNWLRYWFGGDMTGGVTNQV